MNVPLVRGNIAYLLLRGSFNSNTVEAADQFTIILELLIILLRLNSI